MEHRISSTELARRLDSVLGRVLHLGDTFRIERSGEPVARLVPLPEAMPITLRNIVEAWLRTREELESDPDFAHDLEHVNAADLPPRDPRY